MARTDSLWETIDPGSGIPAIQTIYPTGYDILINGNNHYINFGSVIGSLGYGIRDNSGVMEFKNSGGSWTGFGSGGGSGTVTSISVVTANGISGTVTNPTTTPAITLNISALDASKIANGAVSNTEFQYLDGVTSAIQTQIDSKITSIADPNANRLFGWDDTDNAYKFITIGTNLSYDHTTHTLSATGGGGTPGGSDTQVQFNDAGSFGGNTNFIYDKTNNLVSIGGTGTYFGNPPGKNGLFFGTGVAGSNGSQILTVDAANNVDPANQLFVGTGRGNGSGPGGAIAISSGDGGTTGIGGSFDIMGGNGGATSGAGGSITLTAGSAQGSNSDGGNIAITGGAKTGSGQEGNIAIFDAVGNFGLSFDNRGFFLYAGSSVGAKLDTSVLATSDKTFTFPNISGTFAMTVAHARATAQVAANTNILTYTVGAADATLQVMANVLVTASTLHSFGVTVDYTDESNVSRTLTIPVAQLAGTFVTAITNGTGTGPYEGADLTIRAKAGTNIVFKTAGTFTTVTYNVDASIIQVATT